MVGCMVAGELWDGWNWGWGWREWDLGYRNGAACRGCVDDDGGGRRRLGRAAVARQAIWKACGCRRGSWVGRWRGRTGCSSRRNKLAIQVMEIGHTVVGTGGRGKEGPAEWSAEDGSAPWRSGRGGTPSPRVGYGAAAGAPPAVGGRLSTSASRGDLMYLALEAVDGGCRRRRFPWWRGRTRPVLHNGEASGELTHLSLEPVDCRGERVEGGHWNGS